MLTIGSTVLHYEIGGHLGSGGMGDVYRARDTRLGREVALKFIHHEYRRDLDRRARLLKEARAASLLRAPAIATTYDIAEDGDDLFIVMELVEGEQLAERVRRGPLPVPTVLQMAGQVADALDEAHGLGVVHRDIKSANLILTPRNRVKILDFCLAKVTGLNEAENADQPTMAETKLGVVVGTVSYMSPEQALGKPVDHRSDLFSFGVVLYKALAGKLPFEARTVTAIIDEIVHREPPSLARLNYDVPARLEDIVRKLLVKDPGGRYQGAADLLIDIKALRKDLEVERQLSSASSVAVPQTPEPEEPPAPENAVAVIPFSNITREPSDDWIGSGIAETVTADLKSISGLVVIGRERVFDAMRSLGSSDAGSVDERVSTDVGRKLRATWLVSGGYQRLGDSIRITARAVEVATGTVALTVKIDGAISDIFSLQDKIVYELSREMNQNLRASEVADIARREDESVEAYENRSRAIMNIMEGSPQALDRAVHLLERSTALEPNYAEAWAALGMAYDLKGTFLSLPELNERAIEMERKAIALNPKLADAHRWLGLSLMSASRYDEAIAAINEAATLAPGDATTYNSLGRAYWVGKGDLARGIANMEKAVSINPDLGYAHLQLGLLYALRRDFDKAEAACLRAIDMQERFVSGREGLQIIGAYTRLGYVRYLQERYDEALTAYERQVSALDVSEHALKERSLIELNQKIGAAHLRLGQPDQADRYFERAVKAYDRRVARGADDPFTTYYIAALWALRQDPDKALEALGRTFDQLGALNRTRARVDPDFDTVRSEPRFLALMATPDGSS